MTTYLKDLAVRVLELYRTYPAVANGVIASAAVAVAANFHIVLDPVSTLTWVAGIAVILGASGATHRLVTPLARIFSEYPPAEGDDRKIKVPKAAKKKAAS